MRRIPVAQKQEHRFHVDLTVVLGAQRGVLELSQQLLVCIPMLANSGEPVPLQQLLLAGKMHARELDQPVQRLAHLLSSLAVNQRQANLVQGIHQDGVLLVHRFHAYRTRMIPGEKSHKASAVLEAKLQSELA